MNTALENNIFIVDNNFHSGEYEQTVTAKLKPLHVVVDVLTGAFLSIGLITNFLSLKDIFLISLHGKPIFGVNLQQTSKRRHLAKVVVVTRCINNWPTFTVDFTVKRRHIGRCTM